MRGSDLNSPIPGTSFWWLSFADPERPKGEQFLGAAIVPGYNMGSAVLAAHMLGCNPGGEVQGFPILPDADIPDGFRDRLLSREDIDELGRLVHLGMN